MNLQTTGHVKQIWSPSTKQLTSVLHFCTEWMNALNVVYLDFSEAFDKVSHNLFINKLEICGLDKTTVKWIHSWLNSHKQKVIINGFMSSWLWNKSKELELVYGGDGMTERGVLNFQLGLVSLSCGLQLPWQSGRHFGFPCFWALLVGKEFFPLLLL